MIQDCNAVGNGNTRKLPPIANGVSLLHISYPFNCSSFTHSNSPQRSVFPESHRFISSTETVPLFGDMYGG